MSRSFGLKSLVILITALALIITVGSTASIIYLGSHGLYLSTPQQQEEVRLEEIGCSVAEAMANSYAFRQYGAGTDYLPYLYNHYESWAVDDGLAFYTIRDEKGTKLESNHDDGIITEDLYRVEVVLDSIYPILITEPADEPSATTLPPGSIAPETGVHDGATLPSPMDIQEAGNYLYEDYVEMDGVIYHAYYLQGPTYQVTVYLAREAWRTFSSDYWWAVNTLYSFRYHFIAGMIVGLILFLAGLTYLTWAVGRKKDSEEVHLVGLNRLPLDLYGAAAAVCVFACCWFTVLLLDFSLDGTDINLGLVFLACAAALAAAVVFVIYYYALAAQIKKGGGHWWKNSVTGRILRFVWKYLLLALKGIAAVFSMLPLVWQWLLAAAVLVLGLIITMDHARYSDPTPLLLWLAITAAVVVYVAYALGTLMKGVKRMARGDLTRKVSSKYLIGTFRGSANHLNTLADVAVVAARNQLKSERMKTELITNVSHDIKTPLTSIINFVDLLQKPHTEEQGQEYLAVLDRQSQRLKRLIEDLMELSKATTGNLQVNPAPMDACEAVHQALGEFADKLSAARLTPVVRKPEHPVPVMADGRLIWRVLSNLLSNAVKYALPGTRIYIDVVPLEGKVLVSLKNISREELNVSADELMERFVRGDASRNTEGSGLGLNIARSLMEVQKGQLQLLVDGDLFKVTLVFPGV